MLSEAAKAIGWSSREARNEYPQRNGFRRDGKEGMGERREREGGQKGRV